MRTISLWQPWATMLVLGVKQFETRSWGTGYRGPLLIHAAKRMTKSSLEAYSNDESFDAALWQLGGTIGKNTMRELPYGALVGIVDLVDCISTNKLKSDAALKLEIMREHFPPDEDEHSDRVWAEFDLGNFGPNRYMWKCANPQRFETPIPYSGSQGFFEVPSELIVSAKAVA